MGFLVISVPGHNHSKKLFVAYLKFKFDCISFRFFFLLVTLYWRKSWFLPAHWCISGAFEGLYKTVFFFPVGSWSMVNHCIMLVDCYNPFLPVSYRLPLWPLVTHNIAFCILLNLERAQGPPYHTLLLRQRKLRFRKVKICGQGYAWLNSREETKVLAHSAFPTYHSVDCEHQTG